MAIRTPAAAIGTQHLGEVAAIGEILRAAVGDPFAQRDWPSPIIEVAQQPLQLSKSLALVETVDVLMGQVWM